jgi:hypothetical protein
VIKLSDRWQQQHDLACRCLTWFKAGIGDKWLEKEKTGGRHREAPPAVSAKAS